MCFTQENGETFHFLDNKRKVGHLNKDTNGGSYYAGLSLGYRKFLSLDTFWSGNIIKGGSVFFLLNFDGNCCSIKKNKKQNRFPLNLLLSNFDFDKLNIF